MPIKTTRQTVLDAVLYAQAVHATTSHSGRLDVDASCDLCLALHHAVQAAQSVGHHEASTSHGTGRERGTRYAR
jgi:hypothetical protein